MKKIDNYNYVCKALQENEDIKNLCSAIGSDITSKKQTIVMFIEDLEALLVNTDAKLRKLGTEALVQVLDTLPSNFLSKEELKFICLFLCDRIKDHHSLIPVILRGIQTVVGMDNLPSESPPTLCSTVFNNIVCQSQSVADRHTYYSILQTLLSKRIDDLKPISSEFVFGVISAMDSERNPQNLILLFSFLPVFLKNFELGQLTEDTFDVIACYFPVDFTPQSNELNVITREDLANSLGSCLTAIPQFGEFCIPLILEKLDSNLRIAKLDSLRLLIEGCKVWDPPSLTPHLSDLWLYFKKELLPCSDEQLQQLAFSALTAILQLLDDSNLVHCVHSILASCECFLSDIQLSLFIPVVNLLLVVAKATNTSCRIITSQVAPRLIFMLEHTTNERDQVILIDAISCFMKACIQNHLFSSEEGVLTETWAFWPKILLNNLQHTGNEVRICSFKVISVMISYLQQPVRLQLYPILVNTVTMEQSSSVRSACMECLKILAETYPSEVKEHLLLQLKINDGQEGLIIQEQKFEAMCYIAVDFEFAEELRNQLYRIINFLSPLTTACLKCLRKLLENNDPPLTPFFMDFIARNSGLVELLAMLWISSIIHVNANQEHLFTDQEHLITCAGIIDFSVRHSCCSKNMEGDVTQSNFMDLAKKTIYLLENDIKCSRGTPPPHHTQMVVLLESLIGSLKPEMNPVSLSELENILLHLAVHSNHSLTQTSSVRLVATIINKMEESILMPVLDVVSNCVEVNLRSDDRGLRERATQLHIYVCKALALRGHSSMNTWLLRLINLLDDEISGQSASNGFNFIMQNSEHYLNTKSNCNIRFLYRQRVFQILPKLVSSYHTSTESTRIHYLTAVAHLMQGVPNVVLVPQLQLIMPLLVESLNMSDDVNLILTSLQCLDDLLKAKEPILEEHINTFISRFLKLAQNNKSMKVRIAALQCLNAILGYSHIILLPFKQQVLVDLALCLDDKKRLVRKEAVKTRSNWFLLGAPVDDI